MNSIIEDLEEQVEFWRQRAESLENAVAGKVWGVTVAPCSLYQTRLLRVLLKRDMMANHLLEVMLAEYPNTTHNAMKAQICLMRLKLPAHIVPPLKHKWSMPYTIPDRAALRTFLETGEISHAGRLAA
ncbi:MAG TPA: hypothetical protein DCL48_15635 [Alphaproteobacteria bacterium]|nr:hypothetical protein [Alphaproteobacteria bacterium]